MYSCYNIFLLHFVSFFISLGKCAWLVFFYLIKPLLIKHYFILFISDLTIAGQNGFFLNGNDVDSEGNFKWTFTGYPQSLHYFHFNQGQPNNVGNNQDCLLMEYPVYNYEWGDVSCTETHPFICETLIP